MANEQKIAEAKEASGLNAVTSKAEEFDYVAGFFTAAKRLKENTETLTIMGDNPETGKKEKMMELSVHALTGHDARKAKKNASKMMNNPYNKKLPQVVKEVNEVEYQSWLIYFATTDEDRKKYWDNPKFREAFNVVKGFELVDEVLLPGEKVRVLDAIDTLSGYGYSTALDEEEDQEEESDEELAKNS